jgi:ElaB/YqjD/DUF883 family membrane-anchored ribosome-binding protein
MVVWSEGDVMNSLSVTQRPFFYDSVDQTVDRSHAVNRTASAAHHVVDTLADQALTGVGKVSGTLHVAVNHAADAVSHTADLVAQVPAKMRQKRIKVANAAFATIRARPFVTLGSVIAIGYIIGRMARR